MQLSEERIYYLLNAFTNHRATEAEKKELFRWVTEAQDNEEVEAHIEKLIQAHEDSTFPEVDWEHVYQKIGESTFKKAKNSIWRGHIRLKVAAVILVLIIAGGIYLFSGKDKQSRIAGVEEAKGAFENDIGPGGVKAVLQTGSQEVVLDRQDTLFNMDGNKVSVSNGGIKIAGMEPTLYTLAVPKGGEFHLMLGDGTAVWLNSESRLMYPSVFGEDSRQVWLEGEAYFDVAAEADRPFIVETERQQVKVLGTQFNIQAYPDEQMSTTTLVQGNVLVSCENEDMLLQPGQQAQTKKSGRLNLNRNADIDQVVAWKNGYFRFDKADIHTIMKQLSRWYDIKVNYADTFPAHYFGAIMNRDNNISGILKMLEATGDVHFKIEGKEVTVMR